MSTDSQHKEPHDSTWKNLTAVGFSVRLFQSAMEDPSRISHHTCRERVCGRIFPRAGSWGMTQHENVVGHEWIAGRDGWPFRECVYANPRTSCISLRRVRTSPRGWNTYRTRTRDLVLCRSSRKDYIQIRVRRARLSQSVGKHRLFHLKTGWLHSTAKMIDLPRSDLKGWGEVWPPDWVRSQVHLSRGLHRAPTQIELVRIQPDYPGCPPGASGGDRG